jgi:oligoribonuclease NrnB/cAMP/cGMP phosphodiesterase (DHH superfamily)
MVKCFHHTDLDGHCAGAIVKFVYPQAETYEFEYNQKFDMSLINEEDTIFITDVCPTVEEMIEINDKCFELIFVDHHKSAIEKLSDAGLELSGIQDYENKKSACRLMWDLMFDEEPPYFIDYASKFDVWDLNSDVINFFYGMSIRDTLPSSENNIWKDLFKTLDVEELIYDSYKTKILAEGIIARKYAENKYKELIKTSHVVNIMGYRFIAINSKGTTFYFLDKYDPMIYDGMMMYYYTGKNWKISLYNNENQKDLLNIAKFYDGGGHPHSCGFTVEKLNFF